MTDSLNLYCDLFGYSKVIISKDSIEKLPPEIQSDEKFLLPDPNLNAAQNFLQVDCKPLGDNADFLTFNQFQIDLKTLAKVPKIVINSVTYKNFLSTLKNQLEDFKDRGWNVLLDLRNSLAQDLKDYPTLKNQSANEDANYLILCDGNSAELDNFYNSMKNTCRVERWYLMWSFRAFINEILVEYYSKRLSEIGVTLILTNGNWGYDNCLGANCKATSAMIEDRQKFSFYSISENPEQYKDFLSEFYECDSESAVKFFKSVSKIPPIIDLGEGLTRHQDTIGDLINISGGIRYTSDVPDSWSNTIWQFGACVIFGYAIDDANNLASHLQRQLNLHIIKKWRTVNLGIWGGQFQESYARLEMLPFRRGDIVIVNYALGVKLQVNGVKSIDISRGLSDPPLKSSDFFDRVNHCNSRGYNKIAKFLMHSLEDFINVPAQTSAEEKFLFNFTQPNSLNKFYSFIDEVKQYANFNVVKNQRVGAIVMNCNPFTLGHKYLIEYAISQVNFLYVFVVEEDKSIFPFADRIELVRRGVENLKNVHVHRSGQMMISTLTFPSYFMKNNPKSVNLDSSVDVEIFAKYIAPALNISMRFVGEEPFDEVTKNYNNTMKKILPNFGVKVIEIPRKKYIDENGDELVISASKVREFLDAKNFKLIKQIVPPTTYEYLINRETNVF